jgi:hypothetical protein
MEYHVRTIHGMSTNSFSNANGWVLGTLQGSGASPAIWLAVFIAIANAFIKESPGPFGSDPRQFIQLYKSVEVFVDDADLWHVLFGSDDFESALATMQAMAQKWERLLFVSGGALGLPKCFWWGLPGNGLTVFQFSSPLPSPPSPLPLPPVPPPPPQ